MKQSRLGMGWLILLALGAAGCNFNTPQGDVTPTVEAQTPSSIANTPLPTESPFPTVTVAEIAAIVTLTPSPTPVPETPSATPTVTSTPGPYEHLVQDGETLGYIVQLYGYRDTAIYAEVVRINDNVDSPDFLPVGEVIFIPRQTATSAPTTISSGDTSAQVNTVQPSSGEPSENTGTSTCHQVRAGDNVISIAEQYRTTLAVLAQLNPDPLLWNGCNFALPGGGANCAPFVVEGQCFNVPLPTPTPTLSPTPSGSETPTATPTYPAPAMGFPPEGALARGQVRLYWVSAGVLLSDEVYLVEVTDMTTQRYEAFVTKNTTLPLPESWIPTDGQIHSISWTVSVARPDPISEIYLRISGINPPRSFQWQGG